jgi:hypothetical protein
MVAQRLLTAQDGKQLKAEEAEIAIPDSRLNIPN